MSLRGARRRASPPLPLGLDVLADNDNDVGDDDVATFAGAAGCCVGGAVDDEPPPSLSCLTLSVAAFSARAKTNESAMIDLVDGSLTRAHGCERQRRQTPMGGGARCHVSTSSRP